MSLFITIHDFIYRNSFGYREFVYSLANNVNIILSTFDRKINLLELPCITGNITSLINSDNIKNHFISDINLENLITATRKNKTLKIKAMAINGEEKLPMQPNSFDMIVVNNFLYYVVNKANFLNQCKNVLKDDGVIILSEIDSKKTICHVSMNYGFKGLIDYATWAIPDFFFSFRTHLSSEEVQKLITNSGFKIIDKKPVFYDKINIYTLKINSRINNT